MVTINNETLTTADFIVLMLINAADSDFEIHKKEIEYIIERYGKARYLKIMDLYKKDKSGSFSLLIKEIKSNRNLQKERNSILKEVHEILHADGQFNEFENSFYKFFLSI